tara:strand:- start:555 stop:1244 length:690 start_codon:yes stop_codon:yes gene_type:complete
MWQSLEKEINEIDKNDQIRCVVIQGEGNKAFSAGADISEFEKNRSNPKDINTYEDASRRAMNLLQTISKPTVACIDGFCIGGGLALALSCDIRIASEKSIFSIPAAKLGLAYGFDGIKRLCSILGPSRAKYIFYTAKKFGTIEAQNIGIIEAYYSDKEFASKTKQLVTKIVENAPLTIKSAKISVDCDMEDIESYKKCIEAEKLCFSSADYNEGKLAFLQKRKPVFKGK